MTCPSRGTAGRDVTRSAPATRATSLGLAVSLLALVSCADVASTRDVRVTIFDERGEPVSGAIFYVEAADDRGPIAFLWARSGPAGEVPQSAREPLKLPWRAGARLAMVAFAPGRRPVVVREAGQRVVSDGAVLELRPGSTWNPDIARLAFPFEGEPTWAARLQDPSAAPLVDAFRSAWASRPATPLSEEERRKLEALP